MTGVLVRVSSLLFLGLVSSALAAGPTGGSSPCRSFVPTPPPTWVSEVAWTPDGGRLVLANPLTDQLVVFGSDGSFLGSRSVPGVSTFGLVQGGPGVLVIFDPDSARVLWLDDDLRVQRSVELAKKGEYPSFPLPTSWAVTSQAVFAYGETRVAEAWKSGLYRLDPDTTPRVRLVREFTRQPNDAQWELCKAASTCVAAVGGKGYLLVHAQPMRILEAGTTLRELTAFPAGFEKPPALAAMGGPAGYADSMKRLTTRSMAAGLYARGGRLFVLTRRPAGRETRWELSAIDPDEDRVVATQTLPARSPHLEVIPGPTWWALVEKGDVQPGGADGAMFRQAYPRIWLIATAAIEETAGALAGCKE